MSSSTEIVAIIDAGTTRWPNVKRNVVRGSLHWYARRRNLCVSIFHCGTLLPTQALCDAIIQIRRVKIVSSLALYEYREALDLHKRGLTESNTTFAFWVSCSARDACNVLTRGIATPVVVHENHERAGTGPVRIPHDAAGNHRVPVGTGRHRAEHEHSDRSYESIPMCNMERRREDQRGKIALYFACRGHYQCEPSNMNKPHR